MFLSANKCSSMLDGNLLVDQHGRSQIFHGSANGLEHRAACCVLAAGRITTGQVGQCAYDIGSDEDTSRH